ncbi:MAG: hypothetical protein U0744_07005 [Gemmataceae bacterium]
MVDDAFLAEEHGGEMLLQLRRAGATAPDRSRCRFGSLAVLPCMNVGARMRRSLPEFLLIVFLQTTRVMHDKPLLELRFIG